MAVDLVACGTQASDEFFLQAKSAVIGGDAAVADGELLSLSMDGAFWKRIELTAGRAEQRR